MITRKEFWQHNYGLQYSSNQDWKSRAIMKKSTSCWKGFIFAFATTLSIASGRGDLVPSFKLEIGVKETFPIHKSSWCFYPADHRYVSESLPLETYFGVSLSGEGTFIQNMNSLFRDYYEPLIPQGLNEFFLIPAPFHYYFTIPHLGKWVWVEILGHMPVSYGKGMTEKQHVTSPSTEGQRSAVWRNSDSQSPFLQNDKCQVCRLRK